MKFIIVEDNPDEVQLMREAIRGTRFELAVQLLRYGRDAAQWLCTHRGNIREHCLIIDMQLPDGDGRELIQSVHTDPDLRDLPVVVFTNVLELEASCRRLGVSEFAVKPLSFSEFRHTFVSLLERQEHSQTSAPSTLDMETQPRFV
jgi:CheY-like chemotaxis protein